ncbi:MAG: helix-turn-helix domain-containing protein [Xanthobacteraceae bacterium]
MLHFTTDAFAPAEKVAAWREIYGRQFASTNFEPEARDSFMAEATLRAYQGLDIGSIRTGGNRFYRMRERISADDLNLVILESGRWWGAHLGRQVYLEPGDATLCSTAEYIDGRAEGEMIVIHMPAAAVAPLVGDISAGVLRRIPAGTGTLRLLRPYARTLMDCSTTPALQRLATRHVCDLIAVMCGASADGAQIARERGLRAARLHAVKQDIVRNVESGDVSVAAIAARHRISPRYLRRLFESEGLTFSEYVLEQRLALAHRLLSDPRHASDKIASLAFAAGFGDVSYFYRAFRRRYDLLPTDVRAQARGLH